MPLSASARRRPGDGSGLAPLTPPPLAPGIVMRGEPQPRES